MPDVRQTLIDAGWRQGAILAPGPFGHKDAFAFLVLNQTCDCINPDFEKEPYFELLPLTKVAKNPDTRLKNGKNPRLIHFQVQENGEDIWVSARITDIFQFERAEHASLVFASHFALAQAALKDLIEWRAQRYVRAAFPDSFEKAFGLLTKEFGKIMEQHESDIDSILISISPFEEIDEDERYEVQLHLMVVPSLMGQSDKLESLKSAADQIEKLFATSSAFDSPKCGVTSLGEMTLWKARSFLDFSRYDYLSFGKEDASPED